MKQKGNTLIENSKFITAKRTIDYLQKRRREGIEECMKRPVHQEAARSLFFVLILFIDTFLPLEIYRDISIPYNTVSALIVFGVFLYVEIRIYNSIWGKKGRWSIDKYKKSIKKAVEEKKDVV